MEIDIKYEPVKTAASMRIINVVGWAIMLGISILFTYKICVSISHTERSRQSSSPAERSRQSGAPATPNRAALGTPDQSSPAIKNEMSPRTPQPFVDYVRRTIDETPYYRREGRRRVNPQNTV